MRKIEEFNKTQMLMDEFKKLGDKGPEIDNQIEQLNEKYMNLVYEEHELAQVKDQEIERSIVRLEEEMKQSWEDIEFNLDRTSVEKEYKDRIAELIKKQEIEKKKFDEKRFELKENKEKEINELNKQKEEAENEKKEFFTDEKAQTITLEIKDMENEISAGKLEIKKKEIELQQKDIELQEFYDKQEKENPLRWQEIYNEKDAIQKEIAEIKANIEAFEKKIDEYSNFKQEIFNLKYPKKTIELDEDVKVKDSNAKADPTKADPVKDPKEDPVKDPKVDPVKDPKADPVKDPNVDPVKDPKVDPVKDPKADPVKDPKADPVKDPKADPVKDPKADPKPNDKIDLKDVKIIIGKKGLIIKVPGIDKENNKDEITVNLRELKQEKDFWKNEAEIEDFGEIFAGRASQEDFENTHDKMDPNVITAMDVISRSDLDPKFKHEIIKGYVQSLKIDGKVPEDKSLKGIIEYDRTDLDYLKLRNLFGIGLLAHKKQFDEMKHYADIAEETGIADVKQDKPGWIGKLVSNMKNRVKLIGTGDLAKSEAYQNAKNDHERDQLIAFEKHARRTKNRVASHTTITEKNGKVVKTTYGLKKDGSLKKENLFKKGLHDEKASVESSRVHETQNNNTRTEQNTQEQEDEQTVQ